MESCFFTYFVFTALTLKSLNASIDEDCPKPSNVFKSTIIKAQESIARNATLIEKIEDVASAKVCYNLCCNYVTCNVAVIRFEKVYDEDNLESVKKGCYLFDCKTPSVCSYKTQKDFAVITLDRPVVQPSVAVFDEDQITTTPLHELYPNEEKCPAGVPVAMCSYIPCEKASCPGDSSAMCRNSFCGGCKAVFYTKSGEKSNCLLKEQNTEESHNGQVTKETHNEQQLIVSASDEQEEPKEHLLMNYLKSEYNKKADNDSSDPYYSSDRRDWEGQAGQEHIIEYPVNDSTNSTPPAGIAGIVVNDLKLIQSSLISVPLMVALIISLLLLVGLIYHVKCGRRGKPKKVAVDDGDYLINGMYL